MSYERYRVSIEQLENGYKVEVPDMEALAKAKAEAQKKNGGRDSPISCYYGDHMKSYAAKTVKEVLSLVKTSLEKMPESEFDSAFEEAAGKKD